MSHLLEGLALRDEPPPPELPLETLRDTPPPPELPLEILRLTLEPELPLLTLRLELELELELLLVTVLPELELELLLLTLRLELLLLTLRLELLLLTLRLELELVADEPLLTLLVELELELPLLTLLEELVLLGRSYVVPDCTDLDALLLTVREEPEEFTSRPCELERLDEAGVTLLTDEEFVVLPVDCDSLRLEFLATVRSDEDSEPDLATDLEAEELETERLTVLSLLEPAYALLSELRRLRSLSHPPPFTLRFGVKLLTRLSFLLTGAT